MAKKKSGSSARLLRKRSAGEQKKQTLHPECKNSVDYISTDEWQSAEPDLVTLYELPPPLPPPPPPPPAEAKLAPLTEAWARSGTPKFPTAGICYRRANLLRALNGATLYKVTEDGLLDRSIRFFRMPAPLHVLSEAAVDALETVKGAKHFFLVPASQDRAAAQAIRNLPLQTIYNVVGHAPESGRELWWPFWLKWLVIHHLEPWSLVAMKDLTQQVLERVASDGTEREPNLTAVRMQLVLSHIARHVGVNPLCHLESLLSEARRAVREWQSTKSRKLQSVPSVQSAKSRLVVIADTDCAYDAEPVAHSLQNMFQMADLYTFEVFRGVAEHAWVLKQHEIILQQNRDVIRLQNALVNRGVDLAAVLDRPL